ncbi:phage Gp37/Gp68 family protein [Glycomyces terrestris]|uniref:Phage Gp37/Gp68 family protein n=1 Tax=Glycomyces terrestris TaxID=2493553 RepID=A0A426URX4_9ACTN|nr:phage Gp37/Gp68 family protein [Glycomyces terrestris]
MANGVLAEACGVGGPGCDNCYALTMAKRLKAMGSEKYQTDGDPRTSGPGFGVAVHYNALSIPLRWRKPRTVFVNSMSDLFHPKVDDHFIAGVFATMAATPQHTYLILTKRAPRMRSLLNNPDWVSSIYNPQGMWPLPNVWLGVSAEDQEQADRRIPELVKTPAAVRFVSAEPLLGSVDLSKWLGVEWSDMGMWTVSGRGSLLDSVIVGGESGPGARPMRQEWATSLVEQCQAAATTVFVKQMGSVWAAGLRNPKGGDPLDWPEHLRVREMPAPADEALPNEPHQSHDCEVDDGRQECSPAANAESSNGSLPREPCDLQSAQP